jgi:uncharacterized membrane protein YuzA (DUF378 family)
MKAIDILALVLLIVGALNWGLVGLFEFDLVATIFGQMTALSRIVYVVVGLAAVYEIAMFKIISTRWDIHLHRPAHA